MTITLQLWKQSAYADGSHPIVIVVRHKKLRRVQHTGIRCQASQWDEKRKTVNAKHPEAKRAQIYLDKKLIDLKYLLMEGQQQGKSIEDILRASGAGASFIDFGRAHVKELLKMGKAGNARVYEQSIAALEKVLGDVSFQDLTYDALLRFRNYKIETGMQATGINSYLRTLRALWNLAEPEYPYPFKKGLLLNEPRRQVRAHDLEELKVLFTYRVPQSLPMATVALEIWKLGFLLRGMDAVDLLSLRADQVKGSHLVYARKKTGQQLRIKLLPAAVEIFEALNPGNGMALPYALPAITTEKQHAAYRSKYRSLSRRLISVGTALGVQMTITTKTARFSFATTAKHLGVDQAIIREMMGHEDKSTTGLYLDRFPQADIDREHERVVRAVIG